MRKILIITVNIVNNSPQPIRFRNLIKGWQDQNEITVLTKDNVGTEEKLDKKIKIVKVPYSTLGKLLISYPLKKANNNYYYFKKNKIKSFLRDIWKKANINRLIFPDKYIFEYKSFKKNIIKILREEKFEVIIISAYPFSLLKLARPIKKYCHSETKLVYDIGDPFYGNSIKFIMEPFHSILSKSYEKKYLKFIDNLVVISNAVRKHYLEVFGSSLKNAEINVIEQGIVPYNTKKIIQENDTDKYTFIYAGGFYQKLREPFELYKAFSQIDNLNIKLKIFGNIYKTFLPDISNEKFYYGGSITQKEVMHEFSNSDIIVFIDNAYGIQVPGKILEVISVKKPILFIYENEDSPTFEFIKEYKGAVYSKNNSMSIKKAIFEIIERKDIFTYDYDLSMFYWENLASKYLNLF